MLTKPVVVGLLAAGCIAAAAGGAYVAVRQNAAEPVVVEQPAAPLANPPSGRIGQAPVTETEAVVEPAPVATAESAAEKPDLQKPATVEPERPRKAEPAPAPRPRLHQDRRPPSTQPDHSSRDPVSTAPERPRTTEPRGGPNTGVGPDTSVPVATEPPLPVPAEVVPIPPPQREFVEVVVPAASVIGLQVQTSLSSERASVEDRVDARVTRDVLADGRVAIPAGSRMIGAVTLVERGGKIKERARLGVRFHTIVFADGTEARIHAEQIYREGEPPSGESARKIGGAAVGGAILGAILGGGKGAVLGGAAGAAGGTAATMAGDRNPATLPTGTIVTVRLTEPVTLDVEKR